MLHMFFQHIFWFICIACYKTLVTVYGTGINLAYSYSHSNSRLILHQWPLCGYRFVYNSNLSFVFVVLKRAVCGYSRYVYVHRSHVRREETPSHWLSVVFQGFWARPSWVTRYFGICVA
jgi:hypothetical protein